MSVLILVLSSFCLAILCRQCVRYHFKRLTGKEFDHVYDMWHRDGGSLFTQSGGADDGRTTALDGGDDDGEEEDEEGEDAEEDEEDLDEEDEEQDEEDDEEELDLFPNASPRGQTSP